MSRNENTDKSLQQWFNEHKSRGGKSQRRGRRKKIREGQEQETKPNCAERQKSREKLRFLMFCSSGRSTSRLAEAAGVESCGQLTARRCGVKHASRWKCPKCCRSAALLEVDMFKMCAPLWREHIPKSNCETHHVRTAVHCGAKHIQEPKAEEHHVRTTSTLI